MYRYGANACQTRRPRHKIGAASARIWYIRKSIHKRARFRSFNSLEVYAVLLNLDEENRALGPSCHSVGEEIQ
jgi:hypothetical protein